MRQSNQFQTDISFNELRIRRANFLRWLRNVHGWLGLWGAMMGLFFGVTGIIMNHRVILAMPLKKFERTVAELELATPVGSSVELADLLSRQLDMENLIPRIQIIPSQNVVWGGKPVKQPEQWIISYDGTKRFAQAEYWAGNRTVKVTKSDSNLIATLTRLHMAIGVDAIWVLVADTIAGSLILLSISGLILWSKLYTWRLVSILVTLGASSLALWRALLVI